MWQVTPCSSKVEFHEELYTFSPFIVHVVSPPQLTEQEWSGQCELTADGYLW